MQMARWGTFCQQQGTRNVGTPHPRSHLVRAIAAKLVTSKPCEVTDIEAIAFLDGSCSPATRGFLDGSSARSLSASSLAELRRASNPAVALLVTARPAPPLLSLASVNAAELAPPVLHARVELVGTVCRSLLSGATCFSSDRLTTASSATMVADMDAVLQPTAGSPPAGASDRLDVSSSSSGSLNPVVVTAHIQPIVRAHAFTTRTARVRITAPVAAPISAGKPTKLGKRVSFVEDLIVKPQEATALLRPPSEVIGIDRYRMASSLSREERMARIEAAGGAILDIVARYFQHDQRKPDQTVPGHSDITYAEVLERKRTRIIAACEELEDLRAKRMRGPNVERGFGIDGKTLKENRDPAWQTLSTIQACDGRYHPRKYAHDIGRQGRFCMDDAGPSKNDVRYDFAVEENTLKRINPNRPLPKQWARKAHRGKTIIRRLR